MEVDGAPRTFGDGGVYFGPGDARNNLGGLHWDGVWAVQEEEGAPWTPRLIDDFSGRGELPVRLSPASLPSSRGNHALRSLCLLCRLALS